jgi:hypothetical protein
MPRAYPGTRCCHTARVRRLGGWAVAVVLVAACSSSSPSIEEAVPVPASVHAGRTLAVGPGTWMVLIDGHDCVRPLVTVAGRREVGTHGLCPMGPFHTALAVADQQVRFNDRDRPGSRCDDDGSCAAPPSDVVLPSPVLYGLVGPLVGAVCVPTGGAPVVVRPDEGGQVLGPVPADPRLGEPLLFRSDGRFMGQGSPSEATACRDLIAPGVVDPLTTTWSVVMPDPPDTEAVFVAADTGSMALGQSPQTTDEPLFTVVLHPDSRELLVAWDDQLRHVPLPDDLQPCGTNRMVLRLPRSLRVDC